MQNPPPKKTSFNLSAKSFVPKASARAFVPRSQRPADAPPTAQAPLIASPPPVASPPLMATPPPQSRIASSPPAPAPQKQPEPVAEPPKEEEVDVEALLEKVTENLDQTQISEAPKATPAPEPAVTTTTSTEAPQEEPEEENEEEEEDDEEDHYANSDTRKNVNVVMIGHVDAGKSTISGHLMYLNGMVDERTMEKYEREAKEKNREGWKYAWCLDTTDWERQRGKTEECGRGMFTTENKRFTILDAPGHKGFIPHMIGGASQADIAVLVISARRGEFETGFERGGQTREHAMLAKTVGVRQLIVAINKMDESTVEWSKERYDQIEGALKPFLRQSGFSPNETIFIPVSGFTGANLRDPIPEGACSWYSGPTLMQLLEDTRPPERLFESPVRFSIHSKYKFRGTYVMGKLETGVIRCGDRLTMVPANRNVEVIGIGHDTGDMTIAEPGDNVRLKLRGIEEEDIRPGFFLCPPNNLIHVCNAFDAQIMVLEHKSIICAGFKCVLHIQASVEECAIHRLLAVMDKSRRNVAERNPKFVRPGQTISARLVLQDPLCLEVFRDFPSCGRFMLRSEGKTLGVGVITALHSREVAAPAVAQHFGVTN